MAVVTNSSNTGSEYYYNSQNTTKTSLSTNIVIKANGIAVGAIQNIDINESRESNMIYEVGTDGAIDSAPTKSTTISGSCSRIRFNGKKIMEAFGRGFVHVMSQRYPFDIDIIDSWIGEGDQQIITTIKNVWVKSIAYKFDKDNWINSDTMTWHAETIYTTIAGGNSVPATAKVQIDSIERNTDIGGRRGAMDAPGLLNAYYK
jgi:hypothetical protein